jgi:ATP-dependent RNA helicase RhlE
VETGSVRKPSDNVELRTFEVEPTKKQELLEHLLEQEKGSFLVFVRTKHGADRVARRLTRGGHAATQIHGDRTQSQRNTALRSFSEGRHRVLVATDVAARGIDVAHVAHVVNFDLPKAAEDFVHRVGRTGRASARGVASTFAAPEERGDLKKIERALSIQMKRFRVRVNSENPGQEHPAPVIHEKQSQEIGRSALPKSGRQGRSQKASFRPFGPRSAGSSFRRKGWKRTSSARSAREVTQ